MGIPEFLERMLTEQYSAETAARICGGYAKRRPVTLRVNALRSDRERVCGCLDYAGIRWRTVEWNRDALILEEVREPAVRALDIYGNGDIYLQSLSSMIPPVLLEPKAGECILDMAAAPGGKTTQMAALSGGLAQITACEKNPVRAERLKYNLDKQGAARVLVMTEDARKLDPFFSFDKILLDAPCSGSGTIQTAGEEAPGSAARGENGGDGGGRKEDGPGKSSPKSDQREEIRSKGKGGKHRRASASDSVISRELIERSVRTQEALLRKALELLKPGCEMVYSTCSVLRAENEGVLRQILPGAGAKIVPIVHPMLEELPLLPVEIAGTLCVCPTELYEGFFVAKIRKS